MVDPSINDRGIKLWHELSEDETLGNLPPLTRLIQGVRERSQSSNDMLELAFSLCEAHLEISRHEYGRWQGWAIVDATSVFSMQGLARDLIGTFNYDFWGVLREIAGLAQRSHDPAQYHQCINLNLFSSPANDELVLERFHSLKASSDTNNFGCMAGASSGLENLLSQKSLPKKEQRGVPALSPRTHPDAYSSFGRSQKYRLDGQLITKSPFCFNVWLERPFTWLSSVDLRNFTGSLNGSEIVATYDLQLDKPEDASLRVLLSATETDLRPRGRNERHFWILNQRLPLDGSDGVSFKLQPSEWRPLAGNPSVAYGLKCTVENLADSLDRLPLELILVLETSSTNPIATGSLTLPTLACRSMESQATELDVKVSFS